MKLRDLNELYQDFLCDYFSLCTEKQFGIVLDMANKNYSNLYRVEDRLLWYLVETKRNAYPQWLDSSELRKLQELDLPTIIPYYAYVMSYHLYSDKSVSLTNFTIKLYQDKPSLVFTGDFRVEDPITPFLLYTFKPMKDLYEPEIVVAAKYL